MAVGSGRLFQYSDVPVLRGGLPSLSLQLNWKNPRAGYSTQVYHGAQKKSRVVYVKSGSGDTKEDFPRRIQVYSWISQAAPGDVVVVVYTLVAATIVGVIVTAPDTLPCEAEADGASLLGVFSLITFSVQRFLEPLRAFLDVDELEDIEAESFSRNLGEAVLVAKGHPQVANNRVIGTIAKMKYGALGKLAEKVVQSAERETPGDGSSPAGDEDGVNHTARAEEALEVAKKSELNVARIRAITSVVFWGLASCISMILSEAVGVGILHVTGLSNSSVPLDIIITGFAVGAGTKPLNDLLSKLE